MSLAAKERKDRKGTHLNQKGSTADKREWTQMKNTDENGEVGSCKDFTLFHLRAFTFICG